MHSPELLEAPRQPKAARPRLVAGPQDHLFALCLAQPSNPFFDRLQIVAQRSARPHFAFTTGFRQGRNDTIFVDIESQIEFSFHWCVCLFFVVKLQRSGTLGPRPLVRLCFTLEKASSPRKYKRQTHSSFQPCVRALTPRAQP